MSQSKVKLSNKRKDSSKDKLTVDKLTVGAKDKLTVGAKDKFTVGAKDKFTVGAAVPPRILKLIKHWAKLYNLEWQAAHAAFIKGDEKQRAWDEFCLRVSVKIREARLRGDERPQDEIIEDFVRHQKRPIPEDPSNIPPKTN